MLDCVLHQLRSIGESEFILDVELVGFYCFDRNEELVSNVLQAFFLKRCTSKLLLPAWLVPSSSW